MSSVELTCARDGCEEVFTKKKHNQKYCRDECTRIQTNMHIMQKYYERRARRLGHTRMCSSCDEVKLSRYNDEQVCALCKSKIVSEANSSIIEMLSRAIM